MLTVLAGMLVVYVCAGITMMYIALLEE